jgi:hypothetical protein
MTYRVMAIQETGEEICLASRLTQEAAEEKLEEACKQYEEFREFWIECESRYAHLGY